VSNFAGQVEMQEGLVAGHSAQIEDDVAVRRALADRAAFAELYVRYRDPVFRYLAPRMGSAEEAADLTAATFERAIARLSTYRGDGNGFAAWLFRIARNTATDHLRRQPRWRPLDLLRHDRSSRDPGPEQSVVAREAVDRLGLRLRELTEVQRECTILRYASDLTVREIAAVIGKSEAATQKQLNRGLARLKEAYRDESR
jgi:RNA polymerase sigma-70 factor (ECF subfamily)